MKPTPAMIAAAHDVKMMKAEYEKALEAARDVTYGGSNIDPLDALANLLSAIEAQGDEGALPSDYIECRTIDGGVWYYPRMPDVAGEWSRALRLADDAAESVICTEGHSPAAYHWVLTHEQIAADPYLEDCIAHLEWRGIARRFDAEDGVTVIFEEQR